MVTEATRLEQPWWRVKRVENLAVTLTGTRWHVDGQMRIYPAALYRGIEELHGDGSYVLIGGQR